MWRFRDWSEEEWTRQLHRWRRDLTAALDAFDAAEGWARFHIAVGLRDLIEGVAYCDAGLDVARGTAATLGRVWRDRKQAAAADRIAALERQGDARSCAQLQGARKVYRKWVEYAVYCELSRQLEMMGQHGDAATRKHIADAWRSWLARPDRKAFDGPIRITEEGAPITG